MADRIGVLGQANALAIGTNTVYTCPAGKAAKFRLMGAIQGNGSNVSITVNGLVIGVTGLIAANNWIWTARAAGLWGGAAGAAVPDGLTAVKTVAPSDAIYYLNVGQTVTQIITTANLLFNNFQVVGVEVDL